MSRVLLIAPPFYRLMGSHYNGLHLGIAYIASVLQQHGHQVKVYNADYVNSNEYLNQVQLFAHALLYKSTLDNLDAPIWQEIERKIRKFNPEYIGIAMLTANYKSAKNVARIVKMINGNIKVVVGGVHVTLDPYDVIKELDFDYIIRGEGEYAMLELIEGKKPEDIKNLSYKINGVPLHNDEREFIKDLDSLPFPSRDSFINNTKYIDVGNIITGRGCPFNCSYCASPILYNRKYRLRSVDNVIGEIKYLTKTYKNTLVRFADDTFTINRDRTEELCKKIIDEHLNIQWLCDTRVDRLDKELLSIMKKSGCVRVKIGVESGSEKVLKAVNKRETKEQIRQVVSWIKELDLSFTAYYMMGFPMETDDDLKETIEFAKEINADYNSLSVLSPYYGTKIWKDIEKSGQKIKKEHWEYFYHQSREMIVNSNLNKALLEQYWKLNEKKQRL